jgi:enoyl-CoA hydratase
MSYETLRLERPRDGVALLTLDRPERLNALTFGMFEELHAVCAELSADATVRAVVLTGAGRGFCSGLDLHDAARLPAMGPAELMLGLERWGGAMAAIHELPQPVIAAVNGVAAGGGLGVALAADFRLAAPTARFTAAFVRIGLSGGDIGVSWALPRVVGLGHAAELLTTARFVEADEAERIGLVNRIVGADELLDAALATAEQIAAHSALGVMLTKRVLHANVDAPSLRAAMETENRGQALAAHSLDFPEALSAFREGRTPTFRGT